MRQITENDIYEWQAALEIDDMFEWNKYKVGNDYTLGGKIKSIFIHHESDSAWIVIEYNGKFYSQDIKY